MGRDAINLHCFHYFHYDINVAPPLPDLSWITRVWIETCVSLDVSIAQYPESAYRWRVERKGINQELASFRLPRCSFVFFRLPVFLVPSPAGMLRLLNGNRFRERFLEGSLAFHHDFWFKLWPLVGFATSSATSSAIRGRVCDSISREVYRSAGDGYDRSGVATYCICIACRSSHSHGVYPLSVRFLQSPIFEASEAIGS
ncbi:uncharacterized protein BDZ83DRAFT_115131 [Colletotrichum acutatum]|uniref:Uncharacterized protein n=1 Tax=Glomerella acutata TaxID=27357 RepID=A0AAD8UQ91_GLOAC|nr:uncharacterized protein BDZ83DRAFT_115131 [Colletotrichum acutatum]KAK1728627.1 hypothetical protein BDZ83DRAFT_115131 [Colletotrichum acutatum]